MDDLSDAGNLANRRTWWENIFTLGPKVGYHSNAAKTRLFVKPEAEEVQQIFVDTNMRKTTEGRKYLGGFMGSRLVSPYTPMN